MRITGVGSLPHDDAVEAVVFVSSTTDIPYLPQLPNLDPSEGMLRQWGDDLCGAGGSEEGIGLRFGAPTSEDSEPFGGAAAMLAALDGPEIKTQFTGPVTLWLALLAAGCPADGLWACVVEALSERFLAHVNMIRASRPGVEIIAVMDEPALVMFAADRSPGPVSIEAAAEAISRVFADAPIPIGIHVCGDTDWGMVAGLEPAWLSWDLGGLGDGFLSATDAIAEIVSQGTGIMWGMVPTDPAPINVDRVRSRYGTAVTRLVLEGAPAEMLTERAFATPACGLAGTTVGGAGVVMDRLHEVVEVIDG